MRELVIRNKIKVKEYKPHADELHILVEAAEDYRLLRNTLADSEVPFHHFQLPDEKEHKIVIRPIPTDVTVEEVQGDLISQGFPVTNVVRMRRGPKVFPIMLLSSAKHDEGRRCFDIQEVMGIRVGTEPKRRQTAGM